MTDEELDEALAELEEIRMMAEDELAVIRGRKEILEELERDRDALLESYAEMTPEALDALTPEERRQVYGMLRLRVEVAADGRMEAQGILSENVCVQHENGHPASEEGLCENGLASPYNSQNTKWTELRFSAVLGSGASELRFERTTLS